MIVSSAALGVLSIYQWSQLIVVRSGGTPACAVNDTLNCATVWNSPFAGLIHDILGIPVAGLGVLWGVVALTLSVVLLVLSNRERGTEVFAAANKLWALAGLLSTVVFIFASFEAHAVCLTCLGTYALTFAFAFGSMLLLPRSPLPDARHVPLGAAWCLVLAVPFFLISLYPGSKTPKSTSTLASNDAPGTSTAEVTSFIANLSAPEKTSAIAARLAWMSAPTFDVSRFPVRKRKGPDDAPVKIVDFTDVLCGHCRQFELLLGQIEKMVPPGRLAVEPRYFPLDSECNPNLPRTASDGVRCLGAKIQLCLEQNPHFYEVRHELFANQTRLTKELIWELALKSGLSRSTLEACVDSKETQKALESDIEYAMRFKIEGTPLIILNGRAAPLSPVFLLGMAASSGDVEGEFFKKLTLAATP
jgi:serine/threonine-protein kinase